MLSWLTAGLALTLIGLGVALDRLPAISQPPMFAAFHVAGIGGVAVAIAAAWPRLDSRAKRWALLPIGYLVWRVSYFPLMVFSGHMAAFGEWTLYFVHSPVKWLYPSFLIAMALMNGAVAWLTAGLLVGKPVQAKQAGRIARRVLPLWRRKLIAPLVIPALAFAFCIALTTPSDFTPLPDFVWSNERDAPPVTLPTTNPYLPQLGDPDYRPQQRFLVLAAGCTYATIPESPWSRVVKGVLAEEFRNRPHATSSDRVADHYLAYMAAQRFIASAPEAAATAQRR